MSDAHTDDGYKESIILVPFNSIMYVERNIKETEKMLVKNYQPGLSCNKCKDCDNSGEIKTVQQLVLDEAEEDEEIDLDID